MNRRNMVLVCGGRYHDFDYVRLELLRRLYSLDGVRVRVAEDYANTDWLDEACALVTYTTDVIPTEAQQAALEAFLSRGGRWFALHGTNSIIEIDANGYARSPRVAPRFMEMLGSRFIAHPPKGEFEVMNAAPDHPLVAGIDTFTVNDELYLTEICGDIEVLLYARFNGRAMRGFTEDEFFSDERRPILYLREWRAGQVLYLTLGHCRGHLDMEPLMAWYPAIERGPWESPVFGELIDRGLGWAVNAPGGSS